MTDGLSMCGGLMTWTLACAMAELFTAAAPLITAA